MNELFSVQFTCLTFSLAYYCIAWLLYLSERRKESRMKKFLRNAARYMVAEKCKHMSLEDLCHAKRTVKQILDTITSEISERRDLINATTEEERRIDTTRI